MWVLFISAALTLTLGLPTTESVDLFCGEPPAIPSATVEELLEEYPLGSSVTYNCHFGYSTRGVSKTLTCEESDTESGAEWSKPQFSCIPQSCGDPGYIYNGRRIGSLFTFPNSVKYECNTGYKLKGLATRYCQTSGSWSGNLPECEVVTCKPPRNPENGYVTYNSLKYGSDLKYKCDKGFSLNTDETIFCTTDGKWSNTDVQCIESACEIPLAPEHGSVQIGGITDRPRAGTVAIFSCDEGKIADGPTTSKCLDIGKWTFPAPKCVDPCHISFVNNGVIGKYVREGYRRIRVFRKIPLGNKIDDDEELVLRCFEGYEVLGSDNNERRISCSRGRWSQELRCEPALCRSEPPSVDNGQPIALNPEHGGSVLYLCDIDFKKIRNETVICDFGKWKGTVPVCKDTRCTVEELRFPGLVKGRKSLYKDGEEFEIECGPRYQIANIKQRQIICKEGTWKGPLPPCLAESCKTEPPAVKFGRAEVFSTAHSSILKYVCEDPYIPVGGTQVHCSFGEWVGQPPTCEDSRCYLKDLQKSGHVDKIETPPITFSGDTLNVICKEGYSLKNEQPMCLNGRWTQNNASPCRENDCLVPYIRKGYLFKEEFGDYYWSWSKFRYERELKITRFYSRDVASRGTHLWLSCDKGYTFQGESIIKQRITCTEGRWLPNPVCLLTGTKYFPPVTSTNMRRITTPLQTTREKTNSQPEKTTPMILSTTTTNAPSLKETVEYVKTTVEHTVDFETEPPKEECYCEYPVNDDTLIAHGDGKRLMLHDRVKDGSLVILRCKHVGYHILNGPHEIKCENCRNWHSSEFPTCIGPERGSAIILFDDTVFNVSLEGNLEIRKGENAKLKCVGMESRMYPSWTFPSESDVTVTRERRERESYGDVLYIAHLYIHNIDFENEGPYGCAVGNNTKNIINILVNEPELRCPEIPEEDDILITYDGGRHVHSKASFFCTKQGQELVGKAVVTCLRNGEWSDPVPQCINIKCKELEESDLLSIFYTKDREIGSRATFHCFSPGQRSGVSFATCLENGTWSDPIPTCTTPPCSLQQLFTVLPQNVVPNVDNINQTLPHNATVPLDCNDDMIIQGDTIAKCGRKGEWEFQTVHCISGCPTPKKFPDSMLIIKPEKEEYKLGEMVTFSCPPGMSLSTQSQLIMCLKTGWSETVVPECE